jgi:protein dithiol:quinone oxidoreductase
MTAYSLVSTTRSLFLLVFFACAGMILTALYMQHIMNLEPCALCITQRILIIAIGTVSLIAAIHSPARLGIRLYSSTCVILAIIGGGFSARHIWLQHLPKDLVPACGPNLSYLIENFPLSEALSVLLRGDGNCADTLWTFLGLSIPGWTLVAFIALGLYFVWLAVRLTNRRSE